MNNIVLVLMGTGNKVYLNYGVAEGQNLKLIRMAFMKNPLLGNMKIYNANTLCSAHFDNTIFLRLLLFLLLLLLIIIIKYHDERL